jgi:hypothetical protein
MFFFIYTEDWYLVQFEDEGERYSVLPKDKVRHLSVEYLDTEMIEGDYIDAEWPADGKFYDAKVIRVGKNSK